MNVCSCRIPDGKFQSYEDVLNYLNCLGMFHMDLSLDRMEKAKSLLGLRLMCPVIQVVGTNGKGSISTFLHSIALAYGIRAGIFTSPHFVSPLERIKMNDRLLPKAAWASLATQAVNAVPDLTYFELLTVMSVMAYMFSEPDLLIYEAGLGAKYDATTAIPANFVVFTPIALDHTGFLGTSMEEIAQEKACAIRQGVQAVISAPQDKNVEKILRDKAKSLGIPYYSYETITNLPADLHIMQNGRQAFELGLKGKHQLENAQTALIAWFVLCEQLKKPLEVKAIAEGLNTAFIPGRFQQVNAHKDMPALILDGAHNLHSLQGLLATLEYEQITPSAFVFSCLKDKNPEQLAALLEEYLKKQKISVPVYLTQIQNNERAMEVNELAKLFTLPTHQFDSLEEILKKLPALIDNTNKNNPCIVCGSLYLLSEYYTIFPEKLQLSY